MSDASKILEDISKLQEALESNYLKTITIMFTDLKDSTKYFEKHGDIKGRLFIERHNNMLFPIINNHNGVVIKTIGDSIMAKFNSPYLAVRASIKMHKVLNDYNETAIDKIRIRIGIHTGQAIVEKNDIFGDAVNVAARIESDTPPGRTTISRVTLDEIKKYTEIKTRPMGMVKFKGKAEEMETFSVLWRTTELKNDLNDYKEKNQAKNTEIKPDLVDKPSIKTNKEISSKKDFKTLINNNRNVIIVVVTTIMISILSIYFLTRNSSKKLNNNMQSEYNTKLSKDRKKIQEYAKSYIDKKIPNPEKWKNSLSGFVAMVYLYFEIDITNTSPKNLNGSWRSRTELIYYFIEENGKLFKAGTPKAGDLIFFDNTWDRNRNGKADDILTTVGVIIDVDKEGTVYFLYKIGNTIRTRNMNLKHLNQENIKNGNIIKELNSKLRRLSNKDKKKNIPFLSSQLFKSYGSLLDIPKSNGKLTKISDFKQYKYLGNHQRQKIVNFALKFKETSIPKSKLWKNSSSGFIKMIFLNFKLNIMRPENIKTNKKKWLNAIELIHQFINENGKLFKKGSYQVGDLIFLNNTWDKNKNGKFDDKLTSIGIITHIDKDGTIQFLINISGKVRVKYLNLKIKKNKIKNGDTEKIINSQIRYFKKDKKYSYQLFNTFGSIFK